MSARTLRVEHYQFDHFPLGMRVLVEKKSKCVNKFSKFMLFIIFSF